jgi:hypothetical protein
LGNKAREEERDVGGVLDFWSCESTGMLLIMDVILVLSVSVCLSWGGFGKFVSFENLMGFGHLGSETQSRILMGLGLGLKIF